MPLKYANLKASFGSDRALELERMRLEKALALKFGTLEKENR